MRKRLAILMAVVGLVLAGLLGSATSAQAYWQPYTEHLECSVGGYTVDVDWHYAAMYSPAGTDNLSVYNVTGSMNTTPNFQMNRLVLAIEKTPGVYVGLAVYGGTAGTLNDVHTAATISEREPISVKDTPTNPAAFQMLAYGVGPGNSVAECSDYGAV